MRQLLTHTICGSPRPVERIKSSRYLGLIDIYIYIFFVSCGEIRGNRIGTHVNMCTRKRTDTHTPTSIGQTLFVRCIVMQGIRHFKHLQLPLQGEGLAKEHCAFAGEGGSDGGVEMTLE